MLILVLKKKIMHTSLSTPYVGLFFVCPCTFFNFSPWKRSFLLKIQKYSCILVLNSLCGLVFCMPCTFFNFFRWKLNFLPKTMEENECLYIKQKMLLISSSTKLSSLPGSRQPRTNAIVLHKISNKWKFKITIKFSLFIYFYGNLSFTEKFWKNTDGYA